MVRHDHLYTRLLGIGDGIRRRDPIIAGDDKTDPISHALFHQTDIDTITVLDTVGYGIVYDRPQTQQSLMQNISRLDPINIIIANDTDLFFLFYRL